MCKKVVYRAQSNKKWFYEMFMTGIPIKDSWCIVGEANKSCSAPHNSQVNSPKLLSEIPNKWKNTQKKWDSKKLFKHRPIHARLFSSAAEQGKTIFQRALSTKRWDWAINRILSVCLSFFVVIKSNFVSLKIGLIFEESHKKDKIWVKKLSVKTKTNLLPIDCRKF